MWAAVAVVLAATTVNVALVLGYGVAAAVEVPHPTCDPSNAWHGSPNV